MAKDVQSGYDLLIDAVAPRNRDVWFQPAAMSLRGEIRTTELATDNVPGAILKLGGVIPGQRMLVDLKLKQVKIIDRMTLPENAEKDRILRDLARTEKYQHSAFSHYANDVDFAPGDADWPKWLYYMRRIHDAGRFVIVRGTLPTMDQIRTMGDIRIDIRQMSPNDKSKPFNVLPKLEVATMGGKA